MNPPSRPHINLEPKLNDFAEQPASVIAQALLDLYECAFRADQSQHTHLMEQAACAPQVLTDVIHELFYLRREVQVRAAADADAELAGIADDDLVELMPACEAAIADSQRPFAVASKAAIANECHNCGTGVHLRSTGTPPANRQSSIVNRQSPRPPTIAELENDLSLMHGINDDQRRRLEDVALLTRLSAAACRQLNKGDILGILGLVHATINRQPPRRQERQGRRDTRTPKRGDSLMTRGALKRCPHPCAVCSDGLHHWLPVCPDPDDPDYIDHPAVLQGLEAFYECKHCGAWVENIDEEGPLTPDPCPLTPEP